MRGPAGWCVVCGVAVALMTAPAQAGVWAANTTAGVYPDDHVLMFRKYRGADEVDERDHSGHGSGGGGSHDGGGRSESGKGSGGDKDNGSGSRKGGGGDGNPRDERDRFGN